MYTFFCIAHLVRQKFQTPDAIISEHYKSCSVTQVVIQFLWIFQSSESRRKFTSFLSASIAL